MPRPHRHLGLPSLLFTCFLPLAATTVAQGQENLVLHQFERQQLTDVYYSEGANFGDIDGDGVMDVVHGPYWFRGPDYQASQEIYPARAQNREAYSDNFFSWVYDFNGDGRNDVFCVGFPGTPAYMYQNPGPDGWQNAWPRHEVLDSVANESPQLINIVGDERPELVCTNKGYFGYATIDWRHPFKAWTFHNISEHSAPERFGHGLGVGDIDGDGRIDLLMKDGWFQQPASLDGDPAWPLHKVAFAGPGGAEMYAYDVDGDGDNDVITSLAAHEYGLAWYEQLRDGDRIAFRQHLIMGERPEQNEFGLVFTELHSVNLADIDGDGLKDIITGKTYWSHHRQSPLWDAGAVVYWFRLVRGEQGVSWVPYLADAEAGIGRQVVVGDINGDKLPDIVVGGMKGCHVLRHHLEKVDETAYRAAQPQRRMELASGLQPQEAAARMTVPEGFQVRLFAGEPQIHQPVAMALDDRGRVWVAEAYTYPTRAPDGHGQDKIVILEDTDGDGAADSRKVFAEGLNLISGLEVGFGGVWVGAAPYLLFIPDRDGDDRPDSEPTILLDGFGYHDTHETLNGFNWGPDGWLYGCHGVFTHSLVGPPGTPESERTPMNAAIWRYHPTQLKFVFAWGTSNPWGVDFDDHGQAFATACVIPHLFHIIQGARYQRQSGAHFDAYVYDDIKTIADHLHYEGNIRDHAWWGHEPDVPQGTSKAGGGHAHCGAMIYLGDNWPASYRNRIFMNNIHGNRVNMDVLERSGSGYVGKHGADLLLANDRWFRGINLRYGPDGAVYLIDWYDRNACHRTNPEIWDRTNGRVYKISHGKTSSAPVKSLSAMTDNELVDLQSHKNDWYVRTARRLLQERGGNDGIRHRLETLLRADADTPLRLRGLWAIHAIGGLNEPLIIRLLTDKDEYLRAWAIQLALESPRTLDETPVSRALLRRMEELAAHDPSPLVRLYLASAMQRLPLDMRWKLAAALLSHDEDAEDHNLPQLYWYGIEPLVMADTRRALQLADQSQLEQLKRYILRRAAAENQSLELVAQRLVDSNDVQQQRLTLQEMQKAFEGRVDIPMPPAWSEGFDRLMASQDAEIRDLSEQIAVILGDRRIFPKMRQIVADAAADVAERQRALDILVRGRDADAAPAYQAALTEPALRGPALRALAALNDSRTPAVILELYEKLSEAERRDAIAALVARPSYASVLLDAVQQGRVPRTDVHAYHVRQMLQFNNSDLEVKLRDVWGEIRETSADKQERVAHFKNLLSSDLLKQSDAGRGRRIFDASCASCHTLFGEGGKVGPDITGSNRADLDYILENLIDPSAVLGKDYRMTVINTADGRVISGLLQKETDSALTLRTINDTIIVPVSEIDERQLANVSLMPEKLLDSLASSEVGDLVKYLASPSQVAPRGPRATIDEQTGRVAGAIEGEELKVLSATAGAARAQDMKPFAKDRWSNASQLWWTGAKPGDKLELALPVAADGIYHLELAMTRARDYGIIQLSLDGEPLGGTIDLFNGPEVVTTGVLRYGPRTLRKGEHRLTVEIVGAHPQAVAAYMFALDFVRLDVEPAAATSSP
jgi:putative membrane-bound dehydrogenase-like protein